MQNASTYKEEIAGFFICREQGRDYTALKLVRTAVGDEQSVEVPDSAKFDALNDLLDNYGVYRYVKFHTHSAGTIHEYGHKYRDWSGRDLDNIQDSPEGYIGMLFTPETVKIEGNSVNTEWRSINSDDSGEFETWREQLERRWREVSQDKTFEELPSQTKVD